MHSKRTKILPISMCNKKELKNMVNMHKEDLDDPKNITNDVSRKVIGEMGTMMTVSDTQIWN